MAGEPSTDLNHHRPLSDALYSGQWSDAMVINSKYINLQQPVELKACTSLTRDPIRVTILLPVSLSLLLYRQYYALEAATAVYFVDFDV